MDLAVVGVIVLGKVALSLLKIFRPSFSAQWVRLGSKRGRVRWTEDHYKREAAPACSHGSVRCRSCWSSSSGNESSESRSKVSVPEGHSFQKRM